MPRSSRFFEIIQLLRAAARPLTAQKLSQELEVSVRTIYRDIATLQAMRIPIEGEAGVGYMMRRGYDLPPLNFDVEEIEALRVGLLLLARTGDSALQRAAKRICAKVDALHGPAEWLQVSPSGAPRDDPERGCVSVGLLRRAIREERKLFLTYRDNDAQDTVRTVHPIAMIYHQESVLLAAWCELRGAIRHFRTDRIYGCEMLEEVFTGQSTVLRKLWLAQTPQPSLKEGQSGT